MGPRTFLSVREFPWYHLSAVCGSSARQLTGDSSKRARATGCVPREPHAEPLPLWPLLTRASAGDSDPGLVSLCGVSGSRCAHKVLFEPDKSLWRVRGLILNVILPLLPSYWCFSFALDVEYLLFGGTQHSPVGGCSAVSCNFGVLPREDERMSLYSTILPASTSLNGRKQGKPRDDSGMT